MIKKRPIKATDLHDGLMLDFDDDNPAIIRDVTIGERTVQFTANGTLFTVECDEVLYQVTRLTIVCGCGERAAVGVSDGNLSDWSNGRHISNASCSRICLFHNMG